MEWTMSEKKEEKKAPEKGKEAAAPATPEDEAKKKKKKLLIMAIGGVVGVAAIGGGAAMFLGKKKAEPVATEANAQGPKKEGDEPAADKKADENTAEKKADAPVDGNTAAPDAKGGQAKEPEKGTEGSGGSDSAPDFGQTYSFAAFNINLGNPMDNHYARMEVTVEFFGGSEQEGEIKIADEKRTFEKQKQDAQNAAAELQLNRELEDGKYLVRKTTRDKDIARMKDGFEKEKALREAAFEDELQDFSKLQLSISLENNLSWFFRYIFLSSEVLTFPIIKNKPSLGVWINLESCHFQNLISDKW